VALASILATVLFIALQVFIVLLWARFVLDLVLTFSRQWRPTGPMLVIAELVFTITDPPIKLVRRWVRPVRIGAVSIDFAWSIVLLAAYLLLSVISRFMI
jgi:YggT family protein